MAMPNPAEPQGRRHREDTVAPAGAVGFQLFTEAEAAEKLGLTPRTLQAWRRRGEGPPHVRVSSRCVRYRIADLLRWSEENLRSSTSDPGPQAA